MQKELKDNLDFGNFLKNKDKFEPFSINIASIEEDLVLSDDFDGLVDGVKEIGFKVSDLDREIRDYMGFLAFLNIIKTKKLLDHSSVYIQVEYNGKEGEERLTRFYEKMNLWNVKMVIVPKDNSVIEDYINYISAFISKVMNKETFVSMEPVGALIEEKTVKIYSEIQGREVDYTDPDIVKQLLINNVDYTQIREKVLELFKEKEVETIRHMANTIAKSIFDIVKQ